MNKKMVFCSLFLATLFYGCNQSEEKTTKDDTAKIIKEVDISTQKIPTRKNTTAVMLPNINNSHMPTDDLDVK